MRRNVEMGEMASAEVDSTRKKLERCRISDERFMKALKILGIKSPNRITLKYHLEDVELAYEGHLDALSAEREALMQKDPGNSAVKAQDIEDSLMELVERMKTLSEAYEDVREYLDFEARRGLNEFDYYEFN